MVACTVPHPGLVFASPSVIKPILICNILGGGLLGIALDPQPLRRSRRLAYLPPLPTEAVAMPAGETQTQEPGQASFWPHQREPRTFTGQADDDVEEWLTHYQRVSKYNRWDPVTQLSNVVFFLAGTALLWFENHEDSLTTWTRFVEEITKSFGDPLVKTKQAEQTLAHRAQVPGETCSRYIEEVLRLCRLVNRRMSEEDKVGHLLKGIAEDVFNYLITKENIASAADVMQYCRTFEALKTRRITPKFGRLPNVATVASVDNTSCDDIASVVRRIVREELAFQRPCMAPDIENPEHSFQAPCFEPPPAWARRSSNTPYSGYGADWNSCTEFRPASTQMPPYRDEVPRAVPRRMTTTYHRATPASARAPDNSSSNRAPPVCYTCGRTGHISRFCQHRRSPRASAQQPPRFRNSEQWQSSGNFHEPNDQRIFRDGSPVSDRSITPPPIRAGRSPSPRRRSRSPPLGN